MTASRSSNITIKTVMQNLHQALKLKTVNLSTGFPQPVSSWARKIYGAIIAASKDYPGFLAWFSEEFDKLPKGMKPEWYLGAVRGLVGEYESERRAEKARGRAFVDGHETVGSVLEDGGDSDGGLGD